MLRDNAETVVVVTQNEVWKTNSHLVMGPRRGAADPLLYEPVGALEHRVPFPLHAGAARGVEAAPAADKDGEDRVKVGGRNEAGNSDKHLVKKTKKNSFILTF